MLDARHQRRRRARAASGRRAPRGSPRRRWRGSSSRCRRPPPARRARARPSGIGHPDAAPLLGRQRSVGLGLDVLEERRRPRPERAVGEALLPADRRPPVRVRAEPRAAAMTAARWPPRPRRRACRHGRGAAAGPHRTAGRRPGTSTTASGSGRDAARVVAGDDAERDEVLPDLDRARARGRRPSAAATWIVTSRVAASYSTPSGVPSSRAPDDAARPGRRSGRSAARERRVAGPQRVVVVRPDRRPATGRDRLEVHRRSASRPIDRESQPWPSSHAPSGSRSCAARSRAQARRRASAASSRSTWRDAIAACARCRWASVSPGIATWSGSSRIRSVNGSARVSRYDLGPGERDPPVADPDRLDPAEPRVAGERRDAAGDQRVEGHGPVSLAGRPAAPRGRRGRAPPRARGPARPAP